jgi:hemoglobin
MKKILTLIIGFALASLLANPLYDHLSAQSAEAGESSALLYKRLGGYDAIAAVVDAFLARAVADKQLSRFLVGLSVDSKKRLRQHIVDQICEAAGGPCVYTGRPTKAAHAGLGITDSDWQTTVDHLTAILNGLRVAEREKNDFFALVSTLKTDIVEK